MEKLSVPSIIDEKNDRVIQHLEFYHHEPTNYDSKTDEIDEEVWFEKKEIKDLEFSKPKYQHSVLPNVSDDKLFELADLVTGKKIFTSKNKNKNKIKGCEVCGNEQLIESIGHKVCTNCGSVNRQLFYYQKPKGI